MAEIILEDLLHWQRGLVYRAPLGESPEAGLAWPVTWAVTIRASVPVLPTLRGGEIVIIPPRLLAQMEATTMLRRTELSALLADQPISCVMVDSEFSEQALAGVRQLVATGTFPHDAESVINRLLTERRTELFRLGAELSRALSTATIAGAGLDTMLDVAAGMVGRRLILFDAEAAVISASRHDDADSPSFARGQRGEILSGRTQDRGGQAWIVQPLRSSDSRRPERSATLAISVSPTASAEAERLVLVQTAAAIDLVLGHSSQTRHIDAERTNRESLLLDLLLGRLVSREAAEARARLLGIDPSRAIRVLLLHCERGDLAVHSRRLIGQDRRFSGAALSDHEFAVAVDAGSSFSEVHELVEKLRQLVGQNAPVQAVVSDEVRGVTSAHLALEQARAFAQIASGSDRLLDLRDVDITGLHGLIWPLLAGHDLDRPNGSARLDAFATVLLGALEEHDQRRSGELVHTLAAFLRAGGGLSETASMLGVHRNTVSYRVYRIAELSGRDLGEPRTRVLFEMALAIRDVERAMHAISPSASAGR